jgi:uncharacterized membrane protein YdjX (TVP38/TMEM64 family)
MLRPIIVVFLALLMPIIPFVLLGELPGERWLSAADDHALPFALTGAGLLAADAVLPVPSSIMGTLLGARLGFWAGGFWAWAGMLAGNILGYAGGYWLLGRLRTPLPETPTLMVVFLSRPVPVLAEAVAIAAGAERVAFWPFVGACAAGDAIYAVVLAGNGAALLPDALAGPGLILPMALPVAAWWLWRRRSRATAATSD